MVEGMVKKLNGRVLGRCNRRGLHRRLEAL